MLFKKVTVASVIMLLLCSLAFAGAANKTVYPPSPWFDARGGPDAYGYTWVDSDEPGGPAVAWIDITTTGTQIAGLGDDNIVGPFGIGFNFTFYWYPVSQFYVGSNGYVKFPPPFMAASPFPTAIPLPANPNDFIAPYLCDLYFGPSAPNAEAYYWTNNTDQCVISFLNVPGWNLTVNPQRSCNFQVVLNGSDSTIHLNYLTCDPDLYTANSQVIGIENVSGQVGLARSIGANIPHANYTVVYEPPASSTYQAHDFATLAVMNEGSHGITHLVNEVYTPVATIGNVGNQPEAAADVTCTILQGASQVYTSSTMVTNLAPGQQVNVTFPTSWTPTAIANYTIRVDVILTGDMNPNNNRMEGEICVTQIPGLLKWDSGTASSGWSWAGGSGGMAQCFVPPSYPCTIDSIIFYNYSGGTTIPYFLGKVIDDNGPNGSPGDSLFGAQITATTAGWHSAAVTGVTINEGAFYVMWESPGENCPNIGYGVTAPFSRNAWEYTGVWALYRANDTNEIMIRAYCSGAAGDLTVTLTPVNPPINIPGAGGSFRFDASIVNNTAQVINFDAWTEVRLPNGSLYGPLILRENLIIPGNYTILRTNIQQNVPGIAPTGNYTYIGNAGTYPGTVIDSDEFDFLKLPGDGSSGGSQGWAVSGWFGDEGLNAPSEFSFTGASPNPFNPETHLSFTLPQAGQVTLTVFDLQGRLIAKLADGWHSAGSYSVTFEAPELPSGVYFANLKADGYSQTQKLLLLK